MYKSATQPLCHHCGKAIAKQTHSIWFGRSNCATTSEPNVHRAERPSSRGEAQRLINEQIVSISWAHTYKGEPGAIGFEQTRVRSFIQKVTVWDGESYVDEFFCAGSHASAFGYLCAEAGQATARYYEAEDKRG